MATVVLTCFEPFAGRRTNLSQLAVERLRRRLSPRGLAAAGVAIGVLPVTFARVRPALERLLARHRPAALVMSGESRKGRAILVERVALNVGHARLADNAGRRADCEELVAGAPLALAASLDPRQLVARLARAGLRAALSHHAGTFLCNAAFYHALRWAAARRVAPRPVFFLHLPGRFGGRAAGARPRRPFVDRLADALQVAVQAAREAAC